MIQVEQKWDGRLIGWKIFFWLEEIAKVSLRLVKWEEMRYGKTQTNIVEFPWEYDIEWVSVICFEADKKLSYVITWDENRIALLQNAAALEVASFERIDTWLCMDQSVKEEVERLEMDGEIQLLDEPKNVE